jgi:hypothetical protein
MAKQILALPTLERLNQLFNLDPNTGVFTWKINKRPARAGDVAGNFTMRYQRIRLDNQMFFAHRLAYFMYHGELPDGMQVDHINGNPRDNRKCNLRLVTQKQNSENTSIQKSNASGFKGVHWHKRFMKWAANIRTNYTKKHLGYYDTPQEAYSAYCAAADKTFTHDTRRKEQT